MEELFLILGAYNVEAWSNNEPDEVNLEKVIRKTFDTHAEKYAFINGMEIIEKQTKLSLYLIIDKDEYRFLTQ